MEVNTDFHRPAMKVTEYVRSVEALVALQQQHDPSMFRCSCVVSCCLLGGVMSQRLCSMFDMFVLSGFRTEIEASGPAYVCSHDVRPHDKRCGSMLGQLQQIVDTPHVYF